MARKEIFFNEKRLYKYIKPTIIASPNYVFFMIAVEIHKRNFEGKFQYAYSNYHDYLAFVDNDSKRIGIVKLANATFRSIEYERLEGSNITIHYTLNDNDIFSLPYDPSFETVIDDRISNGTSNRFRIRVQGDIMIGVEHTANSIEEIMRLLLLDYNLETSIADYTKHVLLDYIARATASLGLHVTQQSVRGERLFERLIIPFSIRSDKKRRTETLLKLAQRLIETLNLEYRNILVMPGNRYTDVRIKLTNPPMFRDFSLSIFNVENSGRVAPSPYDSIVIELEEDTPFISDFEKNELFQTIRKEVEEALLSMKPQTFELLLGNHFVRLENVYYTSIEVEPKTRPLILPDITISTRRNTFIATQESRIWLMHPEHGVKVVRFSKPTEFRIRTMEISEDYAIQRTRINLKIIEEETKLSKDIKKLLEELDEEDYWEEEE